MSSLVLLAQSAGDGSVYRLSGAGWFIMLTSLVFVSVLFTWCMYRVLTGGKPEKIHGYADHGIGAVDTHDKDDT